MDPNVTLKNLCNAILAGPQEDDTIDPAVEALTEWLNRGGFTPTEIPDGFRDAVGVAYAIAGLHSRLVRVLHRVDPHPFMREDTQLRMLAEIADALPADTRHESICVEFEDADGEMVMQWLGLGPALAAIANQTWGDGEHDWRTAIRATVGTY